MNSKLPKVLNICKGATLWCEGQEYTVVALLDMKTVLAKSHADGGSRRLPIASLRASKQESKVEEPISLVDIPPKQWALAEKRFEIIKPLLARPKFYRSQADVKARAEECKVGMSTLYRWLDLYEATGLMSALIRPTRNDRGRSRVSPGLETIISDVIKDTYLTEQRIKATSVAEEVAARCRKLNLKPPHINTVRNRINELPEILRVRSRHGRHAAKPYAPIQGHFPGADWPLAYVQIDHTPLDIILVDDKTRQPVGRPYITLGMDVFSRMVTGFYLSFDPPSCHTVGLCIAHSVLPKDETLVEFNVKSEWPVQGRMKTIHADNALEFRSDILKRACNQHQINIEWRPVREPQYGGHVERFFRTLNAKIHELPGTTFSSVEERDRYKSEKYSAFTLAEFEIWLTTFIVDKYHHAFHTEINRSPISRLEQGVLGDPTSNILGVGLPPRIVDRESFRIDFMPYIKRSIQNYGMRNHKIYYYHDVLRPWINAKDPGDKSKKRQFVFHYDPRDISKYYFWDPEVKQYFTIPYRDKTRPPISLWELRDAHKKVREDGLSNINEDLLFDAHERLKILTQEAVQKTETERKRQRREAQRKRDHGRQISRSIPPPKLSIVDTAPVLEDDDGMEILPFDNIRE